MVFCRSPGELVLTPALGLSCKHRAKIIASVQLAPAQGSVRWDLAKAGWKRLQPRAPVGSLASGDATTRDAEKKYGGDLRLSSHKWPYFISFQSTLIFSETKGFVQDHVTEYSALFRGTFFCQVLA